MGVISRAAHPSRRGETPSSGPPQPDTHMNGSPLPTSTYEADVGYFVDGTSVAKAGNALFRAPMMDPHVNGSPLPPSKYAADVGYFVCGTAIEKSGNALFRP